MPDQQRNLVSLFAFSAFRILPLCRFVTSLRIWGNMRNDSGHVVWRFDQSASFRIFDSAFYFPHSAFRNSAFYPQPKVSYSNFIGHNESVAESTLSWFLPRDDMRCAVLVIVILSVRPSVRLSHSWTVSTCFDLRIMISSPYGSPIILLFGDITFIPKFEGSHPERGHWMKVNELAIFDQ